MTTERYVRLVAGLLVIVSVVLSELHSRYWLLFTAFVGANLFQSAITGWCLMEDILAKLGVKKPADATPSSPAAEEKPSSDSGT